MEVWSSPARRGREVAILSLWTIRGSYCSRARTRELMTLRNGAVRERSDAITERRPRACNWVLDQRTEST